MKKIMLVVAAIATMFVASCGNGAQPATTGADSTSVDSASVDSTSVDSASVDSVVC